MTTSLRRAIRGLIVHANDRARLPVELDARVMRFATPSGHESMVCSGQRSDADLP
jgi:hypothetical protein